jgi:(1->4)-alpha-D-glucan 1-alpha-D-glucosylmutase
MNEAFSPEPVATYRVQLQPGFGFEEAAGLVAYLADLGLSHLYTSPYLQAAAGSTHGYDVVDPSRVNEELGGSKGHAALCLALAKNAMGHMIDVVPNHMAVTDPRNPWWWDVLENGPASRYATYFDVDWASSEERWPNKVLLPVLGDHYGRILEGGEFELHHEEGVFTLHYYEHAFPIDPSSLPELLCNAAEACDSEHLRFLAYSYLRLPKPTVTARDEVERRHRDEAVLVDLLARLCRETPGVVQAINDEVARVNADADIMDRLIDGQNYRLAYWRSADRDLGYRRFFNINDLAGLRAEEEEVFTAVHALPIKWVRDGVVQGLRIDHPDGLREPGAYFRRLRESCPTAWIVAEKILEPGEKLPPDWPIQGTTGYDFLNLAGGLFIEPAGETKLTALYEEFTGESSDYPEVMHACKRQVLAELLASEINRLTALFVDICERHRRHRDYSRQDLFETLCEVAASFPVYRTYVHPGGGTTRTADKFYITEAVDHAMTAESGLDPELFGFLKDLLLGRITGSLENELAMRFQQLTGPAMAKGVEDTAFYRFNRLVSLNEVGGDPGRFGTPVEAFHQACIEAQAERPHTLLASSTHDTKRSEDVRARLALLSEIPERWGEAVTRWAQHNERHRKNGVPDRNTEYLFYQNLVGAWPIEVERMTSYMEKAIREAKIYTSWRNPDNDYEKGVRGFVESVMTDEEAMASIRDFVDGLVAPGRVNSLAQTVLKLTAPGVPNIYQGAELWDLSLVDPDNRRPVDFDLRKRLLNELDGLSVDQLLARADDGLPKLWVIRQTLHVRRRQPEYFGPQATYRPLTAWGSKARHVVGFARSESVISIVPRLVLTLGDDWADTGLELPGGTWRNVFTGGDHAGGPAQLACLLARFPVALLIKE